MTTDDITMIRALERLRLAPDEVLLVRPRWRLTESARQLLHKNLRLLFEKVGWDPDRVVVVDTDIELTVVKADQMELSS